MRVRIVYYFGLEIGISKAEIAQSLGVGTSAIAMTIMREESRNRN